MIHSNEIYKHKQWKHTTYDTFQWNLQTQTSLDVQLTNSIIYILDFKMSSIEYNEGIIEKKKKKLLSDDHGPLLTLPSATAFDGINCL